MDTPKYKTFVELKTAIDAGEIDVSKLHAYIDNDQVSFLMEGPDNHPDDPGYPITVLDIHPYPLTEQLLDAFGIQNDPV